MQMGDTVFMFFCALLVWLMTPGLALFYGGMVKSKNVLSTAMHSFSSIAIVSIVWVLLELGCFMVYMCWRSEENKRCMRNIKAGCLDFRRRLLSFLEILIGWFFRQFIDNGFVDPHDQIDERAKQI